MMPILLGVAATGLSLHLSGFRWNWPWRVGELAALAGRRGAVRDSRPARAAQKTSGRVGREQSAAQVSRQRRAVQSTRSRSNRVDRDLPHTAGLLLVAVSAGHSVHSAINAVGQVDDGVVGTALARAWQRFCDGSTLADELRALPGLVGEQVRPLCSTLILAMSSGAPLEPALLRLADRERRRVRRRVEQRVRKLPVLMLAPLVTLLLPSFTVLSILPVVLSTAAEANF